MSITSPRSSTSSQSTNTTGTNPNLNSNAGRGSSLGGMGIGSNLGAGVSLLNFHDSVSLGGGERLLSGGSGLRSKEGKGMRMGLGAGFNAISTILNNPTRPQPPIDPSSSRYPPLAPNHVNAELPVVKRSDHSAYIDSVGSEWARWVGSVRQGREGRVNLDKEFSSEDKEDDDLEEREERRTIATRKRLAPLSAVPQVFFSEDFSLGNPYTFDLVTERYNSTGTNPEDSAGKGTIGSPDVNSSESSSLVGYDPALNSMLLEKLSYYSDVLEQHLTLEISARSSSFFNALSNLQDLSASTTSCLESIEALQRELIEMEGKSKKHAEAVKAGEERRIWEERERGVRIVREICRAVEVVGILAEAGEREEALKVRDQVLKALEPRRRNSTSSNSDRNQAPDQKKRIKRSTNGNPVNGLGTPIHLQGEFGANAESASEDEYDDPSNPSPSSPSSQKFNNSSSRTPTGGQPGDGSSDPEWEEEPKSPSPFGESELDLDLSQIPSLASLRPQLYDLSAGISQQVEEELLGILRSDLLTNDGSAEGALSLESIVRPLMLLLVRTAAVERACGQGWRELASGSVKEVVRSRARSRAETRSEETEAGGEEGRKALRDLPALLEDDSFAALAGSNEGASAGATPKLNANGTSSSSNAVQLSAASTAAAQASAQYVKNLEQDVFLEILVSLFHGMMVCLGSIQRQSNLLLRILGSMGRSEGRSSTLSSPSTATSPTQSQDLIMPSGVSPSLPQLLSTTLHLSTDLSHQLFSRLLSLRSSNHSSLTLSLFLDVFRPTWEFILTSEGLSRRMVTGLRGQVLNQAKNWLIEFHRRNIEDASRKVEEERWDQKDVDRTSQRNVEFIIDAATNDPDELIVGTDPMSQDAGANRDKDADSEPTSKTLQIEQTSYAVVQASLDTLNILMEYLKVVINLPMMTTETMGRTVEFLKAFNSRTCQVVLGAGAMRSAGLKNITAKHLALASQSLSIMISLIPYVRETIRRHLTTTQAVMLTEFDKLRRDYQEHQYEIHAKLVAIMSDRLTVHCRALAAFSWSDPLPSSPPDPNKYAVDLVKETATLHKVLTKYLQPAIVGGVMGQVLISIDRRVSAEFDRIEVKGKEERERMVSDKDYIEMKMKALKWVEWKGKGLDEVLERKPIPAAKPVPAPADPPAPEKKPLDNSSSSQTSTPNQSQPQQHAYKTRIPSFPFGRRNQTPQPQMASQPPPSPSTSTPQSNGSPTQAPTTTEEASSSTPIDATPTPTPAEEETPPVPSKDSPKPLPQEVSTAVFEEAGTGDGTSTDPLPERVEQTEEDRQAEADSISPASAAASTEDRVAIATEDGPAMGEEPKKEEESKQEAEPEAKIAAAEKPAPAPITVQSVSEEIEQPSTAAAAEANSSSTASPPAPRISIPSSASTSSISMLSESNSPASTPTATPTKPARMSLQQRLAEAARKRGQAQAQNQNQAQVATPTSGSSSVEPTPPSTTIALPPIPTESASNEDFTSSTPAPVEAPTQSQAQNAEDLVTLPEADPKQEVETTETTKESSSQENPSPDVIQPPADSANSAQLEPLSQSKPEEEPLQEVKEEVKESEIAKPEETVPEEKTEVLEKAEEVLSEKVEQPSQEQSATDEEAKEEESTADQAASASTSASPSIAGDNEEESKDVPESPNPTHEASKAGTNGGGGAGKKKKKKGKKGKK